MEPIGLFRTVARNLPMAMAMNQWGSYELSRRLSLSLREREILIDRTCSRCGADYEWGVHVAVFGARAGLDHEQLASLAHGSADDPCWSEERERLLIQAADSLHETSDIEASLWEALEEVFAPEQLIDLIALCGWYHAISYLCRALRIVPEPGAPTFNGVSPSSEPA